MELENKVFLLGAEWCTKCKGLKPLLSGKEYEYIDVDKQPEVPAEFGLMSVPVIIDNRNGDTVLYTGQAKAAEFLSTYK